MNLTACRLRALREKHHFSQQKVADLLGLTQVKVSREEKRAIAFLREELS